MAARRGIPEACTAIAGAAAGPADFAAGIETEVKLATTAAGLVQALEWPPFAAGTGTGSRLLRSIYFDTANRDLLAQGIVLRIRTSDNADPVLTLKQPAHGRHGPFHRLESEVPAPGMTPMLALFGPDIAAELLGITGGQPLEAQFETRVTRQTRHITSGGAEIEAAFDNGVVVLPEVKELPLCEIELELKSGDAGSLYDLARAAVDALPLTLDVASKSQKGFQLKSGKPPSAEKSAALDLDRSAAFEQMMIRVLSSSTLQFISNWAPLHQTDEAEPIHQMRVSLRRMRTALKIFGHVLHFSEFGELRAEAKRLATALGKARALDAFRDNAKKAPLTSAVRAAGCEALMKRIEQHRKPAYAAARALIASKATTDFVLRIESILARHAWRDDSNITGHDLLDETARSFAAATLERLRRRVLKRGRKLRKRSEEERHSLRIALKDLRYTMEFSAGLFGHSRRLQRWLSKVAVLQDVLGARNDAMSTAQLLQDLVAGAPAETVRAAGFVVGWEAHGLLHSEDELHAAWEDFKSLKPFW